MTNCGNCNKCRKARENKGGEKGQCDTNCSALVDVKVDVEPSIRHTQHADRKTTFDVELDFKTKPRCCISKKSHQKTDKCHHTCVFAVSVDLDVDCCSRVTRPCSPTATFDLDVAVQTDTHCKLEHKKC